MKNEDQFNDDSIPFKYVAFCDVLGFSYAVLNHFEQTIKLYKEFKERISDWPFPDKVEVSVYSDSILIVCDKLDPLLYAVQSLCFATLTQNWLIRGGIAYGKYWEDRSNGNLFVVSDALVRAVKLESTIKVPAIALSPEVEIPLPSWIPRFADDLFSSPILHFDGLNIVNPFNRFWFKSAINRVVQLQDAYPQHNDKYNWFLSLADAVEANDFLVPQSVVTTLINEGVLQLNTDVNGDS